jgi:hypothetical protein
VIEAMGEGADAELEFEAGREVFNAEELVSPRALGATWPLSWVSAAGPPGRSSPRAP